MTATGLKTWNGWVMTAPAEPLQHRTGALLEPGPGEAVVAVAGCGVCHTDLAFLYQGVKTRHPPPLVVREGRADLRGAPRHDGVVGQRPPIDDEGHFRVGLDVAVLLSAATGAHDEDAVLVEVPYGDRMGTPAAADGGQDGDVGLLQERLPVFGIAQLPPPLACTL